MPRETNIRMIINFCSEKKKMTLANIEIFMNLQNSNVAILPTKVMVLTGGAFRR